MAAGNRMSSLSIAQHCGQAPALSQLGSGRAAAMSTAFHARCAEAADAAAKLARLTADERDEIATWHKPADVEVSGATLTYEAAEKELEVGLTSQGRYCAAEHPDCVSVGHLDFAWTVDFPGLRVAFVADIKRSEWTVGDGPESLQLHAYATAYADKVGADAYVTGIWGAVEGQWWWRQELVRLDSMEAIEIADRVLAAARNTGGDFAMGPHCSGCYGRLRCPAYVIAPAHAVTELAPFTSVGAELTNEKASELLLLCDRVEDMADKVRKELKERVRRGLVVIGDGNGKVWRPTQCDGRRGLSAKLIEKAGLKPDDFMDRGKPYDRWGWVKA